MVVDRLSAQDLMMIWPEERGWSQDIGALIILDGGSISEEDGGLDLAAIRDHIERRLHRLPRFRQLLYRPSFGGGWPLWIDAPAVDLSRHIQEVRVDAPAGDDEVLACCESLRLQRWDPDQPLWRMWFLTGLPDGRVGLYVRVHHAIADGVAGIAALGELFDLEADAPLEEPPPWNPKPMPSRPDLVEDNVVEHVRDLGRLARKVAHPTATMRAARADWPAVREAFFGERAPTTSLTAGPIGWDRRFALVRSDLRTVKDVAHSTGTTVNDVLMTGIASGLRALLLSRGESVDDLVLRAFVPVSLHGQQAGQAEGNLDGAMFVPLPIGEADDVCRLALIARESSERKKRTRPPGGVLFRNRAIQKASLRLAPHQHVMNTYVANVPGPPVPLYFMGASVLEVFPVVPLMGNVSVGVGALSYADQFNVVAVVDRDLCPDVDTFVDGLTSSLAKLEHSVLAGSAPSFGG